LKQKFTEKRFVIAAEASGFELKEKVKAYFEQNGYEVVDVGMKLVDDPIPYYEAGYLAGKAVSDGKFECGVVICGSGMGVCMAANKVKGIYCAACESIHTAGQARVINNANVLALGAKIVAYDLAIRMIEAFLNTEFLHGIEGDDREMLTDALGKLELIENTGAL